jgi:hypothetical protein
MKKVAKQTDHELIQASLLSSALDAQESLEDDLNCYLIAQNLEKLSGDEPIFSNPSPEIAHGDYLVGTIAGTNPPVDFGLREEERIRHVIIPGSSGAGKTNTVFQILRQDLVKSKPFMLFDWKRNFRDFIKLPEAQGKEILIFTVGREVCPFHFNPLIPPPKTSPSVWLGKMIEIMAHAFFLGEGVIYILSKALDQIYSQYGVYHGSNRWPTFRDALNFLENYESKGRETQWVASALRSVSMLCFGELDRILNVAHYPIDKLLETNVVLELDALTDTGKIFLTESLLLWIHHYRIAQGKREKFKHSCVIEEAHHILSRKLQMISGTETVTDMILREIREFGEALIIVDQDPSLLSVPALGNTYATICMNLKERNDVNLMASCLNLDYNDKDILTHLEIGQAVVKLQGRHTDPFLISIPKVEIEKGAVTDVQVAQSMAWFYKELQENKPEITRSKENCENTSGIKKGRRIEEIRGKEGTESNNKEEDVAVAENELSDEAEKMLVDIYKNQSSKIGERYKRLGIDRAKGNRVRQLLERRGFIQSVNLPNLESRGYWGKALELTNNGRAALSSRNLKLPAEISKRKGSLIHQHYLRLIAERLHQEGHKASIEQPIGNGAAADILVDGRVAIEFERSDRNTLQNVQKNLAKRFQVVLVAENKALEERISAILRQNNLHNSVRLIELRDFSQENGPEFIPSLFAQSPLAKEQAVEKRARFQQKESRKSCDGRGDINE